MPRVRRNNRSRVRISRVNKIRNILEWKTRKVLVARYTISSSPDLPRVPANNLKHRARARTLASASAEQCARINARALVNANGTDCRHYYRRFISINDDTFRRHGEMKRSLACRNPTRANGRKRQKKKSASILRVLLFSYQMKRKRERERDRKSATCECREREITEEAS